MRKRASPLSRPQAIAWRLLFTCWLVFSLHFATNMVRENYLALAIGDHLSFRVDDYAGLHDDIFETPGRGWHIGSNPGASMLAAIPYAMTRPLIDSLVATAQRRRATAGTEPPVYHTPIEKDRRFFEAAWARGLDLKFGLASAVMQSACMAVISSLGVWSMYEFLRRRSLRENAFALSGALLFAFGTPVFFRTGFLNHNLMVGFVAFAGFRVLSEFPSALGRFARRDFWAGVFGGLAVLIDYSGLVALAALALYGALQPPTGVKQTHRMAAFAIGAAGPLALLAFYQWQAFGHPLYPPQHWMPVVEYVEDGYQGVDWPQPDLGWALLFDLRYGLVVSCPLFLLGVVALVPRFRAGWLSRNELAFAIAFSVALWWFFSGVHYTRWQFNTGVRYLAPAFPFLFIAAWSVLSRAPRWVRVPISSFSVVQALAMAMYRDVSGGKVDLADPDVGKGVIDSVLSLATLGPQLPAVTTLTRMEGYASWVGGPHAAAWPIFCLALVMLSVIWWPCVRSRFRAQTP